jgi:hypothetical protein
MAGTVPTITPGSITGIKGNDRRPVFFLKLNNSPVWNLVVKGEAMGDYRRESIHWSSKLMKNVQNPLVDTKMLSRAEFDIVQQFARSAFPMGTPQRRFADVTFTDFTWVKMPMVLNLTEADWVERNDPPVIQIKKNVRQFSDEGVWNELGKVVAVDIFNGNCDRFDINTGDWVNKGNIMFVAGGATKVIGLDTYDTSGERSNLSVGGGFEALRSLINAAARHNFAVACVKSVGREMQRVLRGMTYFSMIVDSLEGPKPVRIKVDTMENLFAPYVPNFEAGIAAGAEGLKTYLQSKVRQYAPAPRWQPALPQGRTPLLGQHRTVVPTPPGAVKTIPKGVLDRMAFLGWS